MKISGKSYHTAKIQICKILCESNFHKKLYYVVYFHGHFVCIVRYLFVGTVASRKIAHARLSLPIQALPAHPHTACCAYTLSKSLSFVQKMSKTPNHIKIHLLQAQIAHARQKLSLPIQAVPTSLLRLHNKQETTFCSKNLKSPKAFPKTTLKSIYCTNKSRMPGRKAESSDSSRSRAPAHSLLRLYATSKRLSFVQKIC